MYRKFTKHNEIMVVKSVMTALEPSMRINCDAFQIGTILDNGRSSGKRNIPFYELYSRSSLSLLSVHPIMSAIAEAMFYFAGIANEWIDQPPH
jgi:hypothetical protein